MDEEGITILFGGEVGYHIGPRGRIHIGDRRESFDWMDLGGGLPFLLAG